MRKYLRIAYARKTLILTNKVRKRLDVSTARVQIGILEHPEMGAFLEKNSVKIIKNIEMLFEIISFHTNKKELIEKI